MPSVFLGLGSNLQPEVNLRLGVDELARRYDLRSVSAVYRNPAVGFDGDDFLNAVAWVTTEEKPGAIMSALDEIHDLAGRSRGPNAFVSRTLDIDLLLYGDACLPEFRVPRQDVLEYSFVLRPLAELAPDAVHPETGQTFAEHWAAFDQSRHLLTRTDLILLNDPH